MSGKGPTVFNYSPTRSVLIAITLVTGFSLRILVQEKGVMLQENILKAAPRLNKKQSEATES